MEEFFKEFLSVILRRVNENSILGILWSKDVITDAERETIVDLSNQDRRQRMVDIIKTKAVYKLHDFVDSIDEGSIGKEDMIANFRSFLQDPKYHKPPPTPTPHGSTPCLQDPTTPDIAVGHGVPTGGKITAFRIESKKPGPGPPSGLDPDEAYLEWYTVNSIKICNFTVNIDELIHYLSARGMVTEGMLDKLKRIPGDPMKCGTLYPHLVKQGYSRIDDVIECLVKTCNQHIAKYFADFKLHA